MPYSKKASNQSTNPGLPRHRLTHSSRPVLPDLPARAASTSNDEMVVGVPNSLPDKNNIVHATPDDNDMTPTPACIGTRIANSTQHPGVAANKYKQRRQTADKMVEAHCQEAEKQATQDQKREAIIKKIVELEQFLQDTPNIGSTPVISERRKIRHHRAFLKIPATHDELMEVDNECFGDNDARMGMDESEGGKVKGSDEEATEFEDDRLKKKVKIADSVAKGAMKGTQPVATKDAAKEGAKNNKQGKKGGKKVTRTAIDEAREQIAKKRIELELEEADIDADQNDCKEPEIVSKSGGGNKTRYVSFPPVYHSSCPCSRSTKQLCIIILSAVPSRPLALLNNLP